MAVWVIVDNPSIILSCGYNIDIIYCCIINLAVGWIDVLVYWSFG